MTLTLVFVHFGTSDDSTETSSRPRHRCRKPRKEKLLQQLINATANYRSHNDTPLIPGDWNDPYFDNQTYNLCNEIAEVDWSDGRSRPLKDRSLCPWTVVSVTPPRRYDRFPRSIAEARCICRRCQIEGSTHQCRPIYHPMIILKKTHECDERNYAIYNPEEHLIAVGCTCVDASESF